MSMGAMIRQQPLPIYLYGSTAPRHNPGEDQNVDRSGAAPQQGPRAGIDGGARGQHIVNEQEPAPGDLGLAFGRDAESALHVLGAAALVEADLVRRRLDALERRMRHRPAARLGDDLA